MDNVKNYFVGGKPVPEEQRISKRLSRRMSVRASRRFSGVPSTIGEEGSPAQPEFTTFESFGEKVKEDQRLSHVSLPRIEPNHRFSRFSFVSNVTQESSAEEIEAARKSFRMSLSAPTNNRRTTMYTDRNDMMSDIAESVVEESVYGQEDTSENMLEELKHEIMVNYLFQQQCARLWIADGTGEVEGVMLKKSKGNYLACPPALADSVFADSCVELNIQCAMTVNSRVIKTFLAWSPDAVDVPLTNGLRVQVLPTMEHLATAKKHQFAAFLADEALLVVWDDSVHNLIKRAKFIEDELMELVWSSGDEEPVEEDMARKGPGVVEVKFDPESGEELPEDRPTNLENATLVSGTLIIICALLGMGYRELAVEVTVDHGWIRLLFLLLTPVQIFFTLFFAQVIVGCTAQVFGPIKQVSSNSRFYSALLPPRLSAKNGVPLPHLTIQCPVYKEGLEGVIAPTVKSIKAAMSTYELQGGSCNMVFHDDGLQLIDEEERNERIDFYTDNNIGWTARPKHGSEGFIRRGKFKKASNMNFGLMLSCRVEDKLLNIERHENWSQNDEADAYGEALQEVLDDHGRAWADGNIRFGDYILIIDSDTRVPEDCLLDAVSEMERSPEVGIMQFSCGVMQVTWTYFENGITFFTNLIYTAIKFTVANGDVSPFVGHNAILRWTTLQQVEYDDGFDDYGKFWAENTVSEDFDMSLRVQTNDYTVRMAAWAGEGFQEGVSLTVYDELARWEKYAYGCNELLFNPIKLWFTKGLLTDLNKTFLKSPIRLTTKITMLSYIGTYYAIGAVWILTITNYFAIGWFNGYLDKYYLDSWKVWFGLMCVFVLYGNVALTAMRYRLGERTLIGSAYENLKWVPMFMIFLGGLSMHVSQALLSHMFQVDMSWGSTVKEATFSNAWIELQLIWRGYKNTIFTCLLMFSLMIVLAEASFVPHDWKIKSFLAWWPMASVWASHFLTPILLNPALMTFSF